MYRNASDNTLNTPPAPTRLAFELPDGFRRTVELKLMPQRASWPLSSPLAQKVVTPTVTEGLIPCTNAPRLVLFFIPAAPDAASSEVSEMFKLEAIRSRLGKENPYGWDR